MSPDMSLATRHGEQKSAAGRELVEAASYYCLHARRLEDAGDFEAARNVLGGLWTGVGERPSLAGLDPSAAAELLLRAGVLTGWLGSINQIEGAQELAKNLISESIAVFEKLNAPEKIAESYSDLAICYLREGALDEARITLREALRHATDGDTKPSFFYASRLSRSRPLAPTKRCAS